MKELNKLKQELMIMKTNGIKPNYSELARLHKCDRRTVRKYDNGYIGKPIEKKDKLAKLPIIIFIISLLLFIASIVLLFVL